MWLPQRLLLVARKILEDDFHLGRSEPEWVGIGGAGLSMLAGDVKAGLL